MNKVLYDELLKIGRDERSIRPTALSGYTRLLNSYEIRRRAKRSIDREVLSRHASQALKELVKGFAQQAPPRYLVVKIHFGMARGYKNMNVTEREEAFASKESHSRGTFKYHRKAALESIAKALEPGTANPFDIEHSTSMSAHVVLDEDPIRGIILQLFKAAAGLHYALLASLFTEHFNEKFYDKGNYVSKQCYRAIRTEAWSACYNRAFDDFLWFSAYVYKIRDNATLADVLPSDASDSLIVLLTKTQETMPVVSKIICEIYELGLISHLGGNDADREIVDVFRKWQKWYSGEAFDVDVAAVSLESVVARTGAIIALIASHMEFDEPAIANARRSAHKTLAYYYDYDENAPLFDGRSLRHHIDAYFDRRSLELANSRLVWQDS